MSRNQGIQLWRARAYTQAAQPNPHTGRWVGTEFFGFGGPDSHEAVGIPKNWPGRWRSSLTAWN
jgi:hypothetical protein